jgi:hypothetical protein
MYESKRNDGDKPMYNLGYGLWEKSMFDIRRVSGFL